MLISQRSGDPTMATAVRRLALLLITMQWFMFAEAKLSVCSQSTEGGSVVYREVLGENSTLFCTKKSAQHAWNYLDVMQRQEAMTQEQQAIIQNLAILAKQLKVKSLQRYGLGLNPGKSCKDILATNTSAASGIYWIQPTSNQAFQVYCDMTTQGGGWTLVYGYTFTKYYHFTDGNNALTPRPSWPLSFADVPISTTPPLSESSLGAVNYSIWQDIGQDFMVKSNINDWLVCTPNGGSLVTKKHGAISCQNIKNVATACQGRAPDKIHWRNEGPYLYAIKYYYFFEGSTRNTWPTHDPCDLDQTNQKKFVTNPGGQIYLR